MIPIASAALELLSNALGITGKGGAQTTLLEDATLTQVIEVQRTVTRSLSPIPDALKTGVLEMAFAGAATDTTALDPYFIASSPGSAEHWPVPVPPHFDVWLYGVSGFLTGVSGNYSNGFVGLVGDFAGDAAFTQNEAGGAAASTGIRYPLAVWDSSQTRGGQNFLMTEAGDAYVPLGIRVPRGMTIEARHTSTGVVTGVWVFLYMGLVPVGTTPDALT